MQSALSFWTDHLGRTWPAVRSRRRLKYAYPSHAALRLFVFNRDCYKCVRCGATAVDVPADYDGRYALSTNTFVGKYRGTLLLDHILTLRAGGLSVVGNLQSLCETCNKRKQREDRVAISSYGGCK
jgi:5-methylcytosine-specific restriction endonuclease McrA